MKTENLQHQAFADALAALEQHDPQRFERYKTTPHHTLTLYAAQSASEQVANQEPADPFYKEPDPNNLACSIIADFNLTHSHYACTLITDPTAQAECIQKVRVAYCAARDECGSVEAITAPDGKGE